MMSDVERDSTERPGEKRAPIKQPPGTPAQQPNAPVEEPDDAPATGPKAPVQEPEPDEPERL